jgi:hypothetical protein
MLRKAAGANAVAQRRGGAEKAKRKSKSRIRTRKKITSKSRIRRRILCWECFAGAGLTAL